MNDRNINDVDNTDNRNGYNSNINDRNNVGSMSKRERLKYEKQQKARFDVGSIDQKDEALRLYQQQKDRSEGK